MTSLQFTQHESHITNQHFPVNCNEGGQGFQESRTKLFTDRRTRKLPLRPLLQPVDFCTTFCTLVILLLMFK